MNDLHVEVQTLATPLSVQTAQRFAISALRRLADDIEAGRKVVTSVGCENESVEVAESDGSIRDVPGPGQTWTIRVMRDVPAPTATPIPPEEP